MSNFLIIFRNRQYFLCYAFTHNCFLRNSFLIVFSARLQTQIYLNQNRICHRVNTAVERKDCYIFYFRVNWPENYISWCFPRHLITHLMTLTSASSWENKYYKKELKSIPNLNLNINIIRLTTLPLPYFKKKKHAHCTQQKFCQKWKKK